MELKVIYIYPLFLNYPISIFDRLKRRLMISLFVSGLGIIYEYNLKIDQIDLFDLFGLFSAIWQTEHEF
jgi:hypothetical protein